MAGVQHQKIVRYYISIPLENAHCNHEVGRMSTMAPKLLKPEIKDRIEDLVSKGIGHGSKLEGHI